MDEDIVDKARELLNRENVLFIGPGKIGRRQPERTEVVFLIPEAMDPNVVVDPEDVRVWVSNVTGDAEIILQM